MQIAKMLNAEGTAGAMVFGCAEVIAFGALEVRQDFPIAPSVRTGLRPAIEVFPVPANVDRAVDRAGAAQDLAAGPEVAASPSTRIGQGCVAPVPGRPPERVHV